MPMFNLSYAAALDYFRFRSVRKCTPAIQFVSYMHETFEHVVSSSPIQLQVFFLYSMHADN